MASRILSALQQPFCSQARDFVDAARRDGIEVLVYCTKRSPEEQARLWRQGRSGSTIRSFVDTLRDRSQALVTIPEAVHAHDARAAARLVNFLAALREPLEGEARPAPPSALAARLWHWQAAMIESVGPQMGARVVTNALPGMSAHNVGLAFDCVAIIDGKLAWNDDAVWDQLGAIATDIGIEWSGYWTSFIERVHFQSKLWGAE